MNVFLASLAALLSLPLAPQATEPAGEEPLALDVAVEQGLVRVEVSSLGGAVGNTLKVHVENRTQGEVRVALTPGTVFVASSGSVQNLAGATIKGEFTGPRTYRPQSVVVLAANRSHSVLVETYCLDYHKRAPAANQRYTLGKPDPRAMRILVASKPAEASIWAYQSALWMDRSAVSPEELRRNFRLSDADLQAAASLLEQAKQAAMAAIPAGVSAEVRVQLERVFSSDPAARAEAVAALRGLGEQFAGVRALVEANVPPPPPSGVSVTVNTREMLSPESLQALIPDTGAILDQTGNLVDQILRKAMPGADSRLPLPKLPILGQAKPNVQTLLPLLRSALPRIRAAAATRLGSIRDPLAVEALLGALKDPEEQVRAAAAASLKQLSKQDFGLDAEAWQKWWESAKQDFTAAPSPPAEKAAESPSEKPAAGGTLPFPTPNP